MRHVAPSTAPLDALLTIIQDACGSSPPIALRFADGTTRSLCHGEPPRATVVFNRPDAIQAMLERPDVQGLAEGFLRGDYDIEGDIEAIFPLVDGLRRVFGATRAEAAEPGAFRADAASSPHEPERDSQAIAYHYDLSNHVFGLVTGASRVYSAAYFHSPDDSLDTAQANKLDRVCRKLLLSPGETLLDIGCGWGGLILHAVRAFGVRALGVTISAAQEQHCQERIAGEGVAGVCSVLREDYRDVLAAQSPSGLPFDKIASLGMVEHVGAALLPVFFRAALGVLRPGGLFLLQGIGSSVSEGDTRASAFVQNYVFPDGDLPYLTQYLEAAQEAGFEVRDVENLREHYALTHRHWRLNLESHREEIEAEVGMARYRALRLMYGYSTHYFFEHRASVYQILLHRPAGTGIELPMRRPL